MLILLALAPTSAIGQGTTGGSAPWGNLHQSSAAGLHLTVDSRWLPGSGYQPMRFTVTPLAPVVADRELHVEVIVQQWHYGGPRQTRVIRTIEIAAGSGPVQAVLSLPPEGVPHYQINISENGKVIQALAQNWSTSFGSLDRYREYPRLLIVGDSAPDTSRLSDSLPADPYGVQRSGYPMQGGGNQSRQIPLPTAVARAESELPEQWIDYTSADLICLSLDQLSRLKTSRPRTLKAIREWTAAGGNLLVFGIGANWPEVENLEKLLGLPQDTPRALGVGVPANWLKPEPADFNRFPPGALRNTPLNPQQQAAMYFPGGGAGGNVTAPPEAGTARLETPTLPEQPHFIFRPYQMGIVVAMSAGDPFPGTDVEWNWLLNTIGSNRWQWDDRHGVSVSQDNPDFWRFLVPGVGLAPVISFQVLITLFVLAIGPANYWLLRRSKRLYLMAITVPVSAATITIALFGYALISDGLGTRVRVRSVTEIDQRRGEAVTWARLSYYSGLTPGGGLRFPADVMVVPYEASPQERATRNRDLVWRDDQWLVSGWLPSRTATQFLTVRARPTAGVLRISGSPTAPRGLDVENGLGVRIRHLVVRTEEGNYCWSDGLAPGAVASLSPVDPSIVATRLGRICLENDLGYPGGIDPRTVDTITRGRNRYQPYSNIPAVQTTGRMEETLAALAGRLSRRDIQVLGPASYVAIVDESPEVELGTAAATEESSFHVVIGKW